MAELKSLLIAETSSERLLISVQRAAVERATAVEMSSTESSHAHSSVQSADVERATALMSVES